MIPTLPNGEPQKGQHTKSPARADAARPFRTQTPRNALGGSARRDLILASGLAAIGFAVVFAGLTFGPYFWNKSQGAAKPTPAEKTDTPPANQLPVAPAPATPDPGAGAKLPPSPTPGKLPNNKGDIVDKLGENGTKVALPKVNPLDKKDDDILKDIK